MINFKKDDRFSQKKAQFDAARLEMKSQFAAMDTEEKAVSLFIVAMGSILVLLLIIAIGALLVEAIKVLAPLAIIGGVGFFLWKKFHK